MPLTAPPELSSSRQNLRERRKTLVAGSIHQRRLKLSALNRMRWSCLLRAIQVGPEGQHVFVVKPDSSVEVRPVVVARTDKGEAVIAEGLQAGGTDRARGAVFTSAGAKVEIKDTNQETKRDRDKKSGRGTERGKQKAKAQERGES
jgi:hypothetical protein